MGSPSVSSAIAQPKKKSHVLLYSLIAALLVIAVAGGAYWYFHEDEKPQPKATVTTKVKQKAKAKKVEASSKETMVEKVVVEAPEETPKSKKVTSQKGNNFVKKEADKLNNGKKPNPLVTPSSGQAGDYTGKMRKEDNSTEKEIK